MEILKYCTVGFLPRDRYRHAERLSKRVKMKGGRTAQHKAGWAWMNNRQSIMDDKLTKFFLFCLSLSPSLCFFHFLLFSSVLLTVTPCHSFEAHVLEEDGDCHPPLSLLAAFGRELFYFMGFSNLLETSALSISTSQKKKVRLEDKACKNGWEQREMMGWGGERATRIMK